MLEYKSLMSPNVAKKFIKEYQKEQFSVGNYTFTRIDRNIWGQDSWEVRKGKGNQFMVVLV